MKYNIIVLVLLAYLYVGCNNSPGAKSHSHSHETTEAEQIHDHSHEADHEHNHSHDDTHNHDAEDNHNHDNTEINYNHEEDHSECDHDYEEANSKDSEHDIEHSDCDHDHGDGDVDSHNHDQNPVNQDKHDHKHETEPIENEDADSHQGHNHRDVKIQLTSYSENFEFFAEADPFVVGNNSNILAYFTCIPDFKPLASGSITITLKVNGKETSQTLKKPTEKGIFSFNILPEKQGKGEIIFHIDSDKGHSHIVVPDVMVFADEHDAIHHAEQLELPTVNTAVFTKKQSWKINFATEEPSTEPFGQVIKTIARVEHTQNDQVLVSAKTNGIVIFLDDDIVEGKSVNNGQILFSISGKGYADNNSSVRYMEAKNNYEKAKSDYERTKELAKDKIVSERELLDAKNQYDNAKVLYNNLNDNFDAAGQKVTSSVNGYIMHVYVKNGEHVEPGQPIVSLVKNEKLLLHAEVQQKYAPILGNISSANIRPSYTTETYTLEQLNGKVLSHGKHTNDDNYLIPVSIQIDNNDRFISGGFVEVYLKTINNNEAITIKNSAIMEEQGNYFVFVQLTPELFEKREINPGGTDGLKTEIIHGITSTERVVTSGAILIKLAQATGTLDAHSGHVH